ncbi:MAG: hypothetical protein R3C15_16240 [Thermoleophilia bacterium]
MRSPRPRRGRWLSVDVTRLVGTGDPVTLSLRSDGRQRTVIDNHRAAPDAARACS